MSPGYETGFRIHFHCREDAESKLPRNFGTFLHYTRRRIPVELNFSGIFLEGIMSVMGNRTGVFGIATRLRIGRPRGSILSTGKRFCLEFYGIVTPSNHSDRLWGPHSILFSWYRGSFLRVQRPGRKVNQWSYTSSPFICLHGVGRENPTFY
jgi:hypothetical protein